MKLGTGKVIQNYVHESALIFLPKELVNMDDHFKCYHEIKFDKSGKYCLSFGLTKLIFGCCDFLCVSMNIQFMAPALQYILFSYEM